MKLVSCAWLLILSLPAVAQKPLPVLKDGTVIDDTGSYRHDGPLVVEGKVRIRGITLDLRGAITVAAGADLQLEGVHIRVSDPPGASNGTSSLRCAGPAAITIRHSTMTVEGSAHPIWWLQGQVTVDDFQTVNSEFHLEHAHADLANFAIFELEISNGSEVVARHLHLVFLSTHTGNDEHLEFSDIPASRAFSKKMQMGSLATADLTDTAAQMFLLYVHGKSDVALNRIERAQLAIFPECSGKLSLPQGKVGAIDSPVTVPTPNTSDCPFRFRLSDVNVDTWDVYAGAHSDLAFSNSVIDELTAHGQAKISVRDSEIYADWLSLGEEAQLQVERSTVGAQRLAAQRPDLATSQVRLTGHSRAAFDHVKFDCGIVASEDSDLTIRQASTAPAYIRRSDRATVKTEPSLPVEHPGKEF